MRAAKRLPCSSPELLRPPINALRLALHPDGLASQILNLDEWRGYLFERLRHQIDTTADPGLLELNAELSTYGPGPKASQGVQHSDSRVIVPLRLRTALGTLNLISTTMVFGTPLDVMLSELAIEMFLPADEATAGALREISADR